MNNKEQIGSKELLFSIISFILCTIMLIGYVTNTVEQDSWIIEIAGYLVSLLLIMMYIALAGKFPGKSIIGINTAVFGRILGKIISILYAFFFFSLCFLNMENLTSFVVSSLMPETPVVAVGLLFAFVCVYSVLKGIESIMRLSTIIVAIVVFVLISNSILSFADIKMENFMPVLKMPPLKLYTALKAQVFIPFLEIIVFFMVFPSLKKPEKIKKPMLLGLTIAAVILLIILFRNIGVMGNVIEYFTNPAYEIIRMISFKDVLTRMEIFYAILLMVLFFFKVSILLYATAKALEQIFGLKSYRIIVPLLGILVVLFSMTVFKSSFESAFWGTKIAANYSMFFEFILPLITLITAQARGFKKPKEAS